MSPSAPADPESVQNGEIARARGPTRRQAALSPAQKRYLRSFTHALKPVVMVGQKGITANVIAELDGALEHHELVKVKLADDDREARAEAIEHIKAASGADLVQSIGKTACFYRRNPDRAAYALPR